MRIEDGCIVGFQKSSRFVLFEYGQPVVSKSRIEEIESILH